MGREVLSYQEYMYRRIARTAGACGATALVVAGAIFVLNDGSEPGMLTGAEVTGSTEAQSSEADTSDSLSFPEFSGSISVPVGTDMPSTTSSAEVLRTTTSTSTTISVARHPDSQREPLPPPQPVATTTTTTTSPPPPPTEAPAPPATEAPAPPPPATEAPAPPTTEALPPPAPPTTERDLYADLNCEPEVGYIYPEKGWAFSVIAERCGMSEASLKRLNPHIENTDDIITGITKIYLR